MYAFKIVSFSAEDCSCWGYWLVRCSCLCSLNSSMSFQQGVLENEPEAVVKSNREHEHEELKIKVEAGPGSRLMFRD